jgi:hypothetical protein
MDSSIRALTTPQRSGQVRSSKLHFRPDYSRKFIFVGISMKILYKQTIFKIVGTVNFLN